MEEAILKLLNTAPVYVDVLDTEAVAYSYANLVDAWFAFLYAEMNVMMSVHFRKPAEERAVLEAALRKFPALVHLFHAHVKAKEDHMILFYITNPERKILALYNKKFLVVTTNGIGGIMDDMTTGRDTQVAVLVWCT